MGEGQKETGLIFETGPLRFAILVSFWVSFWVSFGLASDLALRLGQTSRHGGERLLNSFGAGAGEELTTVLGATG